MNPKEDLDNLIRSAKAGDRAAFDGLVRDHEDRIRTFLGIQAGKAVREKVEIEDLAQETFLRAFRAIRDFDGDCGAAFWGWLSTIAEHVVLDQARRLRARKPEGRREVPLQAGSGRDTGGSFGPEKILRAPGGSPSQALRREERFERLRNALRSLRPDHARVIYLARVKRLPVTEVARRMQRSPEATSMLLLRALVKLKAAFGGTESFHLPDRSMEEEGGPDGR